MGDPDRIVVARLICSSSMMYASWCGLVSAPDARSGRQLPKHLHPCKERQCQPRQTIIHAVEDEPIIVQQTYAQN